MTPRRITPTRLYDLAQRLTARDRAIIRTLNRVRVATARQLQALHFTDASPRSNARMAQRTLRTLVDLGVLARLDRLPGGMGGGAPGNVFSLDSAGRWLLSPGRAQAPRRPWPVSRMFLDHALAVTDWYVNLVEAEHAGFIRELRFTAEPKSWRYYANNLGSQATLKPDAYVELVRGPWVEYWFLEVDRGTEHTPALKRQLDQYVAYWQSGLEQPIYDNLFPLTLWIVPSPARHDMLIDTIGRLSADYWQLFRVATPETALHILTTGRPP
jgi:hypothetical protein